jgi:hypothetical protein
MQLHATPHGTAALDGETLELLHARYEAYCAREAAALPALLPREGLRALYRSARERATGPVADPLALLVAHCRALLPLPPFEVWLEDYLRDRRPYLEETDSVGAPRREAPITVELRRLEHEGRAWLATLSLFREPAAWRGFIAFHPDDAAAEAGASERASARRATPRTADIFREDSSEEVRARFRSFTPDTLQAFLRSALP